MSFGDEEKGYQRAMYSSPYGRNGDSEYIRLNEKATREIQQLSNNVTSIQRMVNQIGTAADTQEMRDRLHDVGENTRSLSKNIKSDLEQLAKIDGGSPEENKQRKMQQSRLIRDFEQVLKRFSDIQKISSQKEREYIAQKARTKSIDRDQGSSGYAAAEENQALIRENEKRQKLAVLDNEIQYNEGIILEREEGIKEIEGTVHQVNEIFRDLGALIKEQGDMLDNIESNIENVVVSTTEANTELQEGAKYQKKARTKMCILLIIGIIILAILILVIVFVVK